MFLILNIDGFRPKFRSYKPEDEKLQENIIPSAQPGDVVAEVKDHLEAANSRVVIEELVSYNAKRWVIIEISYRQRAGVHFPRVVCMLVILTIDFDHLFEQ